MADVNVEFGAKDTGLEATLKTVQEQMTKLESEVKSGTLSFEELSQKMRQLSQAERINEKLRDIGDASAEARPKVNDLGDTVLDAGRKSDQSAGLFDASFQKIAGAFTVGNLAAKAFEKIIELAFSAARAVVDSFGEALDLGGRLNELSARTGEAAGKLLVLEQAFRDSGLSADQVGVAINKLQNFMAEAQAGGDAQAQAMQRLGISMADLAGKTPTQQMQVFAQAISAIEDPTQRAAIAGDVFGEKLGGRLLPLLTQFSPALDDAGTKVGSLADVMDENAATFDRAGESIDAAKGKLTAFAAGILNETIPSVESLGTTIEGVDAAGLGQKIGEMLAPALQKLTDATTGALSALQQLSQLNSKAATDTGLLGETYRNVTASLNGFNQMMHNAFTQFTPFGAGMELLRLRGEELRNSQIEAGAAIEQTGTSAENAAAKLSLMPSATDGTLENITEINGGLATTGSLLDSQNITLGTINSGYNLWKDAGKEINSNEEQRIAFYDAQREKVDAIVAGLNQTLQTGINIGGLNFGNIGGMASVTANAKSNMEGIKTVGDAMNEMPVPAAIVGMAEKTAEARKLIEKFGNYIGVDLSNMSFPDIVDRLNIPGTFSTMSEQIDAIVAYINEQMQRPVDLTIQTDFDPNLVRSRLEEPIILNLGGFDPNQVLTPLEQERVDLDLRGDDAIRAIQSRLNAPIDMVFTDGLGFVPQVRQDLESPFSLNIGNLPQVTRDTRGEFKTALSDVPMTVRPDEAQIQGAIADMNAEITNNFTGGQGGPGGEGGQGGQGGRGGDAIADINSLVTFLQPWTQIITAIRDRLPMQALAY